MILLKNKGLWTVLLVALVAILALYLSLTRPSSSGATFVPMQLCEDPLLSFQPGQQGPPRCGPVYAIPIEQEYGGYSSRGQPYETM